MQRTIGSTALWLAIALPAPARAAEGTLEIFPDIARVISDPSQWPQTHFVQLLVLFVLLIYPVNRFVLAPLLGVLEQRAARIAGSRKRAGEIGTQADAVLARYEAAVEQARKQADEVRKAALESARGDQARILNEARRGAEHEVVSARSSVMSAVASARAALRAETESIAREVAARVLGRNVS